MSDPKKNDGGIVSGILLIAIGIIASCATLFDIEIVWSELMKLWPVLLIILGISMLPLGKLPKSLMVLAMVLLSFVLYYIGINEDDISRHEDETCHEYSNNTELDVQEFSEAYRDNIETAEVNIDYGAGVLRLNPPVDELVKASNTSNHVIQDFSVKYENRHADINFDLEDNINISVNGKNVNSNIFNVALNKNPIYEFEINIGASNMNFDLSQYKVSKIEIDGGACNIDLKLGELHDMTEVSIETGVSDVRIGVPTASGCCIKSESVLASKSFDGFEKISSGTYETSNYYSADNIVNIEFTGAVADLKIYRY